MLHRDLPVVAFVSAQPQRRYLPPHTGGIFQYSKGYAGGIIGLRSGAEAGRMAVSSLVDVYRSTIWRPSKIPMVKK